MKYSRVFLFWGIAGFGLAAEIARAATEDLFLGPVSPQAEQTIRQGRAVLWTLPLVAAQYQPSHPAPAMQQALQAQEDGRFLDALILLDEAIKSGQASEEGKTEINLLRASFLLQGNQSGQSREILAPLLSQTRYAADAYALTAMAHLQQGQMQEALQAAQHAHDAGDGILPHLALSYALQGEGRLAEAREAMRDFNGRTPQAVSLAREAELALTLGQVQAAKALLRQAREREAAHPYVLAVSGLAWLIDGQAGKAKPAFETALRRDPRDARALLGLGLTETRLGNLQGGLKKLQAAHEADPGNALILTYLGRAQLQSGQDAAARESWRNARQADPKDPIPWLYQAQAELQASQLQQAGESVHEAQARTANRTVYRGERLLREDEQLLQANLAEIQRRQGLESIAFHTLADPAGEKNAPTLRNMADLLEGRRFGESARRSLLLQSLFNEHPGSLPATLDIYGDGAGQTGASVPQHGVVSSLTAQHASYHNYDELFGGHAYLEADATTGNQNTNGGQMRFGVGNDLLGLSMAQRQFKTDGNAPFENLDNRIAQATVQWRPLQSTQAFVSYQTFHSQHGETVFPAFPWGYYGAITDNSYATRIGLRHNLAEDSELRGLWSSQQTDQANDNFSFFGFPLAWFGSSNAHDAEVQYRRSGVDHVTSWGLQYARGQLNEWDNTGFVLTRMTQSKRHAYVVRQQTLNSHWQLEAGLGWGKADSTDNLGTSSTSLTHWLPRLGVVYAPDEGTHLRLAAWKDLGAVKVGDATLAPTMLAGMVSTRPGDSGSGDVGQLLKAMAVGADWQLGSAWLLDVQAQRRWTDLPVIFNAPAQDLLRQQVDEARMTLHWQPQGRAWAVSLTLDNERLQYDARAIRKDGIQEQRLRSQQLALRWFPAAQWMVNLAWGHNQVSGMESYDLDGNGYPVSRPYQDGFNQLDASLSWRFVKFGSLSAGVRNASDTRHYYTEIEKLVPRFSNGRLAYAKLKLTW
ncbi:MAG: TonB-dependent receptor [Nitrosomonadales bacterium]|nr:TonB-dependent receptor [Nitrosomonadales bacterium]